MAFPKLPLPCSCLVWVLVASAAAAQDAPRAARRGFDFLVNKSYLPADFDQETFDQIWRAWPPALQTQAAAATPLQRREMAYRRYGLTFRPDDPSGKPLQYVVDAGGNWSMNCFTCHGGNLLGKPYPGRPNSDIGLQSLVADVRLTKLIIKKQFSPMDAGSLVYPLGMNRGLTNSVMFGVTLMAYRNPDLTLRRQPRHPTLVHHDMDPPPWWNFRYRRKLYIDAFATKSVRSLMPFLLVPENGPDKFDQWQRDYEDVYAYLESLTPPVYPFPIDAALAATGEHVFHHHCAECHGTYGEDPDYPERVIPIDEIGTDRVRLDALQEDSRSAYADSWFTHFRRHETILQPAGYVAPPLHGIWASAPYFHNGSVPTLWHVLRPDQRPAVWRRKRPPDDAPSDAEFDTLRVGLTITELERVPALLFSKHERRQIFRTSDLGKSAGGHEFPARLTASEKEAVLEYLKTL